MKVTLNKKKLKEKGLEKKGITLIVLVITIIILLILAGITIGTLTGENGLIKNAKKSKEQTEIANEKEILEKAATEAMGKNKYGNIEESELQSALNKETGDGKTEAVDTGEQCEVLFKESNRYYVVDKDGNVGEAQEFIEDKYPGDITVGKDGEQLDGNTEETAYQIWCIEDLCAFSNEVNNGSTFSHKNVKLMRDLNFNSNLSYVNGNISVDGNIQSCDSIEKLKERLTENEGFYPVGDESTQTSNFRGAFDGNNKKIEGLYINNSSNAGVFGKIELRDDNVIIKNLEVTGEITGNFAGGIVANVIVNSTAYTCKIENCINKAKITGKTEGAGGIIGIKNSSEGYMIISECMNFGEINGRYSGGIVGDAYRNVNILNCYNAGRIMGGINNEISGVGGIVGYGIFNLKIYNSYNKGNIETIRNGGGIIGKMGWSTIDIENCYSIGQVSGNVIGGIAGSLFLTNELLTTQNCYYLKENISKGIGDERVDQEKEDIQGLTNEEMKSGEILEELNNYVTENKTKEGIALKEWIRGESGYPEIKY